MRELVELSRELRVLIKYPSIETNSPNKISFVDGNREIVLRLRYAYFSLETKLKWREFPPNFHFDLHSESSIFQYGKDHDPNTLDNDFNRHFVFWGECGAFFLDLPTDISALFVELAKSKVAALDSLTVSCCPNPNDGIRIVLTPRYDAFSGNDLQYTPEQCLIYVNVFVEFLRKLVTFIEPDTPTSVMSHK